MFKSLVIKNGNLYFLALLFQLLDGGCTPANYPFLRIFFFFDQENCKATASIHIKGSLLLLTMVIQFNGNLKVMILELDILFLLIQIFIFQIL